MTELIPSDYKDFLVQVKKRIHAAQYEALKKVNKELIAMYWDIGAMIVERRALGGWGKSVVAQVAKDLQNEFPSMSGLSTSNLWRIQAFFKAYSNKEKLAPLVREIAWTSNIIIMEKCKDDLAREFYLIMTRKYGWTKNVLIHQIENQTYEKTLLNQTNFSDTLPEKIRNQAKLAVKDEYTFDFLELSDEHSEHQLEESIMPKMTRFLREMGGMLSFIGNQYRLEVEGNEYFIDLLLYHRRLQCLVAIELKTGKFLPEYVGKMQFYLTALDELSKTESENPSIGIILCKSKEKTIVEYTLRESKKPIGVASYRILTKLPKELRKQLPTPEQISHLLEKL